MLVQRGICLLHICQRQIEWGFKCAGTVKIRGFDTFRVADQDKVDAVLVTLPH